MSRIRRVLFASDFSPASRRAFATAMTLTRSAGAKLIVLHVIEPVVPMAPDQYYLASAAWDEIDRNTRTWAGQQLAGVVRTAKKHGVTATTRIVDGVAATEIVRAARSLKADLIVLGTHGRTGLSRLLLGSVATRVVATATCPVVTVRGGGR